eukprot:m.17707 g.17707  ORF g.17707 m.17707 type:complete len:398 (-) comp8185_c0_seq4:514-1707(-)
MDDIRLADWIGFDLDHSAVRYNVPALSHLVFDAMAKFEVEFHGYSENAFVTANMPHFFARGLVFDCETGCFLRLSRDGAILSASHGTMSMSKEAIETLYSDKKGRLDSICRDLLMGKKPQRAFMFVTFFDIPGAAVLASMIDDVDARVLEYRLSHPLQECNTEDGKGERCEKEQSQCDDDKGDRGEVDNMDEVDDGDEIATDEKYSSLGLKKRLLKVETIANLVENMGYDFVLTNWFDGLNFNFNHLQFARNEGYYFPMLKQYPHKYIFEAPPEVASWLMTMKTDHHVNMFLLTNSHQDYATFLLKHTFGEDWKSLFDIVVFYGSKPQFFHNTPDSCPFVATDVEGTEQCKHWLVSKGSRQKTWSVGECILEAIILNFKIFSSQTHIGMLFVIKVRR